MRKHNGIGHNGTIVGKEVRTRGYKGLWMAKDWYLVKQFNRSEQSAGGIVLLGAGDATAAVVVNAGPGLPHPAGGYVPMTAKVGDLLLYVGEAKGILHEGEQLYFVNEASVVAAEEPTAAERRALQAAQDAPRLQLAPALEDKPS